MTKLKLDYFQLSFQGTLSSHSFVLTSKFQEGRILCNPEFCHELFWLLFYWLFSSHKWLTVEFNLIWVNWLLCIRHINGHSEIQAIAKILLYALLISSKSLFSWEDEKVSWKSWGESSRKRTLVQRKIVGGVCNA